MFNEIHTEIHTGELLAEYEYMEFYRDHFTLMVEELDLCEKFDVVSGWAISEFSYDSQWISASNCADEIVF